MRLESLLHICQIGILVSGLCAAMFGYGVYRFSELIKTRDSKVGKVERNEKHTEIINKQSEVTALLKEYLPQANPTVDGKSVAMDKLINYFEVQLKLLKEHYEKSLTDPDYISEVCVKLDLLVGTKDSLFLKLQRATDITIKQGTKADPNADLSTDEFMELVAIEKTTSNGKISLTKRQLVSKISHSMGGSHVSFSIDTEFSELIKNSESITINDRTILMYEIHATARTILTQGDYFLNKSRKSFLIPNQQHEKAKKLTKERKYSEALVC